MAEGSSVFRQAMAAVVYQAIQAPPVPYRDGPLDYTPLVMCPCNLKSLKLISWSTDNPCRPYYRCQNKLLEIVNNFGGLMLQKKDAALEALTANKTAGSIGCKQGCWKAEFQSYFLCVSGWGLVWCVL